MDQTSMVEFGMTLDVGEEIRMGCYEHTFVFSRPIAGVEKLSTLNGMPYFTPTNRCVVISDGFQLVILDRVMNHGVRLAIPREHWFEASLTGSLATIKCYEAHGGKKLMNTYEIETHVDSNRLLVPTGWKWDVARFPEDHAAMH